MTATTKPFDNISGELTLKEVLSTSFSGSLFNTAMVIVASIFIFLAIIWLYHRNYYFKALGIMKTMGLLVSSGILFGVTFKVLLTTIRVFAGSYGCVNCSNVKLILTLVVTVFIMFLSLSLLFSKWLHENIGLLPEAAATVGTDETVDQGQTVDKDALAKVQAVLEQAVRDAQAVLAQAEDEQAAQAVRDAKAVLEQAVRDAQAVLAQAAQAALAKVQAQDAQAVRDAKAVLAKAQAALAKAKAVFEQAVRDAQAAQAQAQAQAAKAVFEQAARDAQAAQEALAQAQEARAVFKKAVRDAQAALAKAKDEQAVRDAQAAQEALAQAQEARAVFKKAVRAVQAALAKAKDARAVFKQAAQAALNAQKTPQEQTAVPADSASLQTAANN
ncbi:hypothetical protein GINT2_002006 [Glugoides intestinalis]